MSLEGTRVLVTGADGFIGSHLTEALVRAGADVRAFVLYNSLGQFGWLDHSERAVREQIEIFPGDIRDPHRVKQSLVGIHTVFHLASLIAIPYSYRSPDSYVETNIRGTLNLLQASLESDVSRVIHTSTSEVYGTAAYVPMDEKHPLVGQSPYAASKIGADQMADAYHRSYGLPVVTLRPFNTYGPRQSARAIIPTIITQLANGVDSLRLGSREPVRDLTYVDDTVRAFLLAADTPELDGELINIGTGSGISIGDLADKLITLSGRKVSIATDQQRIRPTQSEVMRLVCDNSQALTKLGWNPKVSLDDGLHRTFDWLTIPENLALYKPDQYII